MKKRFVLLISVIAISLIISVSAFLLAKTASTSPPSNNPIECNILHENAGGINIVFFATKEQAEKYSDYLLSVEPFSKHKDKFSFYFITPDQYSPECNLYQGIALLCYSSNVIRAASACPNDYIVALGNQPSSIRSSAFRGVMSLNINHPLSVFTHEFYHVFDNAAEEYSSPGASIPRGSENCQRKCEDFRQFPGFEGKFGCHQECTTSSYFREFENGFMRTLNADRYGQHNELILDEEVKNQFRGSTSITGRPIYQSPCAAQQFYLIEFGEELTKEIIEGCAPSGPRFGDNTYQITDAVGEIISEGPTHSDILFTTDFTESGEITAAPQIVKVPLIITSPATGREQTLEVFNESGRTLFQTELRDIGGRPCKV